MATSIPNSSDDLYHMLMNSNAPAQLLDSLFESASYDKDPKLRRMLKELEENDQISIRLWADNRPYLVAVFPKNDTKSDNCAEVNSQSAMMANISNQNITIGNGNTFRKSLITSNNDCTGKDSNDKKSFYEQHPIACAFTVSLVAGFILLLPFWREIINFFGGMISG